MVAHLCYVRPEISHGDRAMPSRRSWPDQSIRSSGEPALDLISKQLGNVCNGYPTALPANGSVGVVDVELQFVAGHSFWQLEPKRFIKRNKWRRRRRLQIQLLARWLKDTQLILWSAGCR